MHLRNHKKFVKMKHKEFALGGGFCPGGFCLWGLCPGGFCPGGFCPRTGEVYHSYSTKTLASINKFGQSGIFHPQLKELD